MTDRESRERLVELILNAPRKDVVYGDIKLDKPTQTAQTVADHLLANDIIVPPCKVGQKVYYIFEGEIRELTVTSLSYMFSETFKHLNLHTTNHRGAVLSYEIKDIGKTVFLTKEEAEEKLKENKK